MKRFRISKEKNWKKAELAELREKINTMTNAELCEHYGVSSTHLVNTMQKHKIKRDESVLSQIQSENKKGENNPNWKNGISKDSAHYQALQRQRHPEHKAARAAVYRALKEGRLVKPVCCEDCGAAAPTQGHHESYEPNQWLIVVWLCRKCHRKRHPQH